RSFTIRRVVFGTLACWLETSLMFLIEFLPGHCSSVATLHGSRRPVTSVSALVLVRGRGSFGRVPIALEALTGLLLSGVRPALASELLLVVVEVLGGITLVVVILFFLLVSRLDCFTFANEVSVGPLGLDVADGVPVKHWRHHRIAVVNQLFRAPS